MDDPELQTLLAALRASGPDLADDPAQSRPAFEAMLSGIPVPDDVRFDRTELGGVPALRIEQPGVAADAALLYLHGGGYVIGSAEGYRVLAAGLARAAGVTGWSIDYRLAPEHPFPAAIEDVAAAYRALLAQGIAPGRIVLAGDSAGGGLAVAALVHLRDAGLPLPAAALAISPWADLACTGHSITAKMDEDPALTVEGLRACAARYVGDGDLAAPLASPVHADLHGLPPLLIQVGSAEILFDDAVALARAAGAAGTHVQLEVWPGMVHVWHAFGFMLGAGRRAIEGAGAFLAERLADG